MAKVMISVDDNLLERIDSVADSNYMSRSGLISIACSQFINSAEAINAIRNISVCVQKIADNGTIDHDTIEQLEDFERVCKVLMGTK